MYCVDVADDTTMLVWLIVLFVLQDIVVQKDTFHHYPSIVAIHSVLPLITILFSIRHVCIFSPFVNI